MAEARRPQRGCPAEEKAVELSLEKQSIAVRREAARLFARFTCSGLLCRRKVWVCPHKAATRDSRPCPARELGHLIAESQPRRARDMFVFSEAIKTSAAVTPAPGVTLSETLRAY